MGSGIWRHGLCGALIVIWGLGGGAMVSAEVYATGERVTYAIRQAGIKVGDAVTTYEGPVDHHGRDLILIVFKADGFNFFDEEKIYADPVTLLPVRVERDVNIFGKKEQIVEEYDQSAGRVTLTKMKNGKIVEETVISKTPPIDNLYCFIYRYRRTGVFDIGSRIEMRLPTKDVAFEIKKSQTLTVRGQRRETVFMQSVPKQYQVWFDQGTGKVPVRIDGAMGMARTHMIWTGEGSAVEETPGLDAPDSP